MRKYVVRRLFLVVPVLLAVSIVIFTIMRVLPGDVALLILGGEEGNIATQENLRTVRHQLGLDKPLYQQYLSWLSDMVRLDPGDSFVTQRPLMDQVRVGLPLTMQLAVLSILIALVIAIPTGIISALLQDTWIDYISRVVAIAGLAVPSFWFGILLLVFTVNAFGWAPPLEYTAPWANPKHNLLQMLLPSFVLGSTLAAVTSRMTRSMMLEVLREDYIRTARSKGLRETAVVLRHAVRNAILPVLTIMSIQFGHLLGGTVVIETVFNLPGMGLNLINAIQVRDFPMVQLVVMMIATVFASINLAVDLLYAFLDPRIRYA